MTDRPQGNDQQESLQEETNGNSVQHETNSGDNTHSNDIPQNAVTTDQPESCIGNNVARTQEVNEPTPSTSGLSKKALTPEIIRPLPKAGPRKGNRMNKRKRFSAILTDTPVKNALQKNSKQKTHTAQRSFSATKKQRTQKSKLVHDDEESSEEEDSLCLVCMDSFSNSKSREVWVQCRVCSKWAHEDCTNKDLFYTCHNCDSDDDLD